MHESRPRTPNARPAEAFVRSSSLRFLTVLLAIASAAFLFRGRGVQDTGAQAPVTPAPGVTRPLPPPPPPPPLPQTTLSWMDIAVDIRDLTAFTTLNFTCRNSSERPQEATLL